MRVGYSISHPDVANLLNRVRQPFNVNSLALTAATAALADRDYLNKSVASNESGMQLLSDAFNKLGLSYIPSLGNFISVNVGDGAKVYELLLRQGIITRPIGGGYGMPQHLRVSIGLPSENERFLQALNHCEL